MTVDIVVGDCRAALAAMPAGSVHCVVTSPPYFGLRDYGVDGQIGQEPTPAEFVAALVEVFREVRRVLRPDGTAWLNLGDSYAARGGLGGVKAKDLIGIPWLVAFALREDGWYLRGDFVWGKPNGMPESVEDRPTRSHEYVFLLTRSPRYWYDAAAVRTAPAASTETRLQQDIERQAGSARANAGGKTNGRMKAVGCGRAKQDGHGRRHAGFNDRWSQAVTEGTALDGANLRSVWWISPAQYAAEHFATMPERLAEICIRAGCPEGGTVLDPFGGAGTTGLVASLLRRNAILLELNPKYAALARARIDEAAPLFLPPVGVRAAAE